MYRLLYLITLYLFPLTIFAQTGQPNNGLTIFYENDTVDYFAPFGFTNAAGDTIIPLGKYSKTYNQQFEYFGVVRTFEGRLIAIDTNDRELFEVYWFDNMPDNEFMKTYGEGELFRIKVNGLIGFANFKGKIVIQPQYECASYFQDGMCWVAKKCTLEPDGEYRRMVAKEAYYIDVKGNFVKDGS